MTEQVMVQDSEQVVEVNEKVEIEQEVEQEAEKIKEPTPQEKISHLRLAISQINEYIDFANNVLDKNKGYKFVLYDTYCEVTKRTKTGHLDIAVYKNAGTLENPEFGKFSEKKRFTQDELALQIIHAKKYIYRYEQQITELEKEINNTTEEGEKCEES